MAAERDLELLDDYLSNRLDPQSRSAFEQKLETDPSLRSEYDLQKQFVRGIQNARAAELKSFMNSIPVPAATTGGTIAAKVIASTLIVGAIGTGLYFVLTPEERTPSKPVTEQPAEVEPEVLTPSVTPSDSQQTEESPEVPNDKSSIEQVPVDVPKPIRKAKPKLAPSNPKVEVYDPSGEQNQPVEDIENLGIPRPSSAPALSVQIKADKKFDFHYQFKDGQLLLYGPFEKNLYEILEFIGEEKRTTFLSHKGSYYLLKEEGEKIRPLTAITDPTVIKALKAY